MSATMYDDDKYHYWFDGQVSAGEYLKPRAIADGDVDDIISNLYHIDADADADALRRALAVAVGDLKTACRAIAFKADYIWDVENILAECREYVRELEADSDDLDRARRTGRISCGQMYDCDEEYARASEYRKASHEKLSDLMDGAYGDVFSGGCGYDGGRLLERR